VQYRLRKLLHRHIQSLRGLRDRLGSSRTARTFEIGQIALGDCARAPTVTLIDVFAYAAALTLAGAAAFFSIKGLVVLFPGAPTTVVGMTLAMESAKLVAAAWLARRWRGTAWIWRFALFSNDTAFAQGARPRSAAERPPWCGRSASENSCKAASQSINGNGHPYAKSA